MQPLPCETVLPKRPDPMPLAIYIHWPFCQSICPYCDFNRYLFQGVVEAEWQKTYGQELRHWAQRLPTHRVVSLFLGGGTPSLMSPHLVGYIVDEVTRLWNAPLEITMEMNPTSAESKKLQDFRHAGVNRASLGIQSFCKDTLKFLGRKHSVEESVQAITWAQTFFPQYSLDLIYAHHRHADPSLWRNELEHMVSFNPPHVSLYQLSYEPGTPFGHKHQAQQLASLSADETIALYEMTEEFMEQRGWVGYEISNYGRQGHQCRHNMAYWLSQDHIGIGPGAHGRITLGPQRMALCNHRLPQSWKTAVLEKGHGLSLETALTTLEFLQEKLLMGLRLHHGIPLSMLEETAPLPFLFHKKILYLQEAGLLDDLPGHLKLSSKGRSSSTMILEYLAGCLTR